MSKIYRNGVGYGGTTVIDNEWLEGSTNPVQSQLIQLKNAELDYKIDRQTGERYTVQVDPDIEVESDGVYKTIGNAIKNNRRVDYLRIELTKSNCYIVEDTTESSPIFYGRRLDITSNGDTIRSINWNKAVHLYCQTCYLFGLTIHMQSTVVFMVKSGIISFIFGGYRQITFYQDSDTTHYIIYYNSCYSDLL